MTHSRRSRHRLRVAIPLLASFLLVGAAVADDANPLPKLVQETKAKYKAGEYKEALALVDRIDTESRKPGFEKDRQQLAPLVAFYRAVGNASLGEEKEAVKQFQAYLALVPNAVVDPKVWPEKVVAAFQKAKAAVEARPVSAIGQAWAAWVPTGDSPAPLARWAEEPVRTALTRAELTEWSKLGDDAARKAFIDRFWQQRNVPGKLERADYEKRVRFADATFTTKTRRGSESDRGLVFILLGPPPYVGKGMLRKDEGNLLAAQAAGSMNVERLEGSKEVWRYDREALPAAASRNEVTFEFVTKEGYGEGALDRTGPVLNVLEVAEKALKKD